MSRTIREGGTGMEFHEKNVVVLETNGHVLQVCQCKHGARIQRHKKESRERIPLANNKRTPQAGHYSHHGTTRSGDWCLDYRGSTSPPMA